MHFSSTQPILSCESRYTESRLDREFHQISLASPLRIVGHEMLLLYLNFAVPNTMKLHFFWWRSAGLRASNRHWWKFWLDSLSTKRCPQVQWTFPWFNNEGIMSLALFGIVSRNSNNSTLRISRIIAFDSSLNGRLEVLHDEDDSRSSSRVREHGSFLLVSQLHVAIQTLWSQCLCPRAVWTNRWIVHFQPISPFLLDLRPRFRLRLCLDLKLLTDTGTQLWLSPFTNLSVLEFVLSRPNKTSLSISWVSCCSPTGLTVLWLDSLGIFAASSNFWIQFFHPIIFEGNRWKKPRWHKNFVVFDFSRFHHNSCRDTISWECIVKGWLRYILFDRTSILFVEQAVYRPNTPCPGVFSTSSACTMQDMVWSNQAHTDLCVPCSLDSQPKRTLSVFPFLNIDLPLSILNLWGSVNWLHIRCDKWTRRNRSESTHCPAV